MDILNEKQQNIILNILIQSEMCVNIYKEIKDLSINIDDLICEVEESTNELDKQIIALKEKIIHEIETRIKFFEKKTIFNSIMSLKQYANNQRVKSGHSWELSNLVKKCVFLQRIILSISDNEYHNNKLNTNILEGTNAKSEFLQNLYTDEKYEDFQDNIALILFLAKEYLYLVANEELYKKGHKISTIRDFIEAFNEDINDIRFYDEYISMGNNLKPELLEIKNVDLFQWIKKKKISNINNYNLINNDLKKEIGFNINDLEKFQHRVELLFEIQEDVPLIIVTIEQLKQLLEIDDEYINSIINFFAIDNLLKRNIVTERHLELRSFYRFNEFICFGMDDLLESIHMFKSIIISGHFVQDYYFINTNNIKNINTSKNNMSTLMAYKIVDIFEQNGYIIPYQVYKDKNIPLAEVRDLYDNEGKNIFVNDKDYGDIDILAANLNTKKIYNIEFKYFAPAINYDEAIIKDKRKIKKQYVTQVKGREDIINKHKKLVMEFLGIETENHDEYSIKSILVTARPNYFAINEKMENIEYLTWVQLIKKINNKEL